MYVDIKQTKDKVIVWERDLEGTLHRVTYPIRDFCYAFLKDNTGAETEYTSIFGDPVRKVNFNTPYDLREYAKGRDNLFETDISPLYRVLVDQYRQTDAAAKARILLYDIEVDYDLSWGKGYPLPENPYGEINSFSMIDFYNKEYYMIVPDKHEGKIVLKDEIGGFPVTTIFAKDEKEMLLFFCDLLDELDIDVFSAWNGEMFDISYIMERLIKCFGESRAKTMMCRDGFEAKKREFTNENGQDIWTWDLVGRVHIDMMMVYKKFTPGTKRSYSLDSICEEEIEMKKTVYDGDLGNLYRRDPQRFFEYSLRDSQLMFYLEEKINIVQLAILMARQNCVKFGDVMGSVKPIENGLLAFCREKGNLVLPDRSGKVKAGKFDGAIVYDTVPGRHGWMFSIDLTALYPSAMIMLGVSPETLMMQCMGGYEDYIKIINKSSEMVEVELIQENSLITLPAFEIEALVREEGFTISANGTIFRGDLGILSEFTQSVFQRRKAYKDKMKESKDKELIKRYDLFQKVFKILANSIYGACGNEYFRLFDIRIAQSITLTGQMISKFQAIKANQLVEEVKEMM